MMVLQHLRGWWGTWTGRNTSAWRPRWPWQNPREPAGPKPKRRRRQGLWKRKMKLMKEGLWELLGVVLHQCQKGHISWPPRPPEVGDPLVRTGRAPRKCPSRRAPDGLQGLSKTRPTPVTERKTQQWGAWSMRGACGEMQSMLNNLSMSMPTFACQSIVLRFLDKIALYSPIRRQIHAVVLNVFHLILSTRGMI